MFLLNKTQNTLLADQVEMADTLFPRCIGLLGRPSLSKSNALILKPCRSIHMFFMRFAIDVVFVDKNDRVVGLVEEIKPFRMSAYFSKASYAIELPAGTIARTRTQLGDQIFQQE